jgi:hypothetical protein
MASPLLNNVLGGNNINAPISSLVEEDDAESLFVQLTSSLSPFEMMALMQGNLSAIQGINQKLKTVLIKRMGGQDSQQKRKTLVETEATKFKEFLKIPNEISRNIHEGFDPLLVSGEIVDSHFERLLDVILDFDQSRPDAEFIEEMKDAIAYFIGEWIEELQDGFINGMSDVVIFFRDNFKDLIIAGAGPEMGMMIQMMGTDTIMRYVNSGYSRFKDRRSVIVAAAKARAEKKKATLTNLINVPA